MAMLVPAFWAEARTQQSKGKRQVMRRFGWSDLSQEDAQAMADARAGEPLQRALAGEPLIRREPKVLTKAQLAPHPRGDRRALRRCRHHQELLRCALPEHPNVLFADVDATAAMPGDLSRRLGVDGVAAYVWWRQDASAPLSSRGHRRHRGGHRVHSCTAPSPGASSAASGRLAAGGAVGLGASWLVGPRPPHAIRPPRHGDAPDVLAGDPQVTASLGAIRVDKVYARMCANQQCFRARLTPSRGGSGSPRT